MDKSHKEKKNNLYTIGANLNSITANIMDVS